MNKPNEATRNASRVTSRKWHGSHHTFTYRPQAYRWKGHALVGINFISLSTDMRAWLMQRGQIPLASTVDQNIKGGYTNPFTFSGITLALILARVVNAYLDYGTTHTSKDDAIEAEIERLRLYNEVVLYTARFSEVVIKQLLYCMNLPESHYERKALGELLESHCPVCKKENGKKPHMLSLVGSLAHPFGLCLEFEHCAMDHMALVNKLRNTQAAHSGIQTLNFRTIEESKGELQKDCKEIIDGLVDLLMHFEKLEDRMLNDLAAKGEKIELLRLNGLPTSDANFRLVPGEPFEHIQKTDCN